jgi:hypothetical protein
MYQYSHVNMSIPSQVHAYSLGMQIERTTEYPGILRSSFGVTVADSTRIHVGIHARIYVYTYSISRALIGTTCTGINVWIWVTWYDHGTLAVLYIINYFFCDVLVSQNNGYLSVLT